MHLVPRIAWLLVPLIGCYSPPRHRPTTDESIKESSERTQVLGTVTRKCKMYDAPVPDVPVFLYREGSSQPLDRTTSGPDGSFSLNSGHVSNPNVVTYVEVEKKRLKLPSYADLTYRAEIRLPCSDEPLLRQR
jgi:hypothetical protein